MINSRRVQKRYMPLLPTNEDKDVLLFSNDFHPPFGHALPNALQIKPLTEEEKREKLAELRSKMTTKRTLKAEEDAKEAKANEKIRRKQDKVRSIKPALALLNAWTHFRT